MEDSVLWCTNVSEMNNGTQKNIEEKPNLLIREWSHRRLHALSLAVRPVEQGHVMV